MFTPTPANQHPTTCVNEQRGAPQGTAISLTTYHYCLLSTDFLPTLPGCFFPACSIRAPMLGRLRIWSPVPFPFQEPLTCHLLVAGDLAVSVGKRGHLAGRIQSKRERKKVEGGSRTDETRKEEIEAGMWSEDQGINININNISGKGQLVCFYPLLPFGQEDPRTCI